MNQTFYIFRHGETFVTKGNKWGYGLRVFSAPILPEARPALEKLGAYLKDVSSDYNVSSEFLRCKQTVGIIAEFSDKQFVFDRRLNEHFLEPFGRFRNRLQSFLTEMEQKQYKSVLICTHGACIAALTSFLMTGAVKPMDLFTYPMPGVLTIINNKQMKQIDFNAKQLT